MELVAINFSRTELLAPMIFLMDIRMGCTVAVVTLFLKVGLNKMCPCCPFLKECPFILPFPGDAPRLH